jgi:hypothetical protein
MKKQKDYTRVFFPAEVLVSAYSRLLQMVGDKKMSKMLSVQSHTESWDFDTIEEFIADYRSHGLKNNAYFNASSDSSSLIVSWRSLRDSTTVVIEGPDRPCIEGLFEIFESAVASSRLPDPPPRPASPPPKPPLPVVFIGHGRSGLWRELKDHLQDKHKIQVEAYEVGARAGHTIRDILDDMLTKSSFALLVLTAEDDTADGKHRARQNVVHETGLFQGRLGFARAIVLMEDGVEEFSNINGVQQLRFSKGNIKEIFGDVLATVRREFPNALA